jgi:hypothetical protein
VTISLLVSKSFDALFSGPFNGPVATVAHEAD